MSYTIIRETKICKLENGDIIHFELSECNNDTEGRSRGDFKGKYYKAADWAAYIDRIENTERPAEGWDLKIGNRYCCYADYGKHLRRMTKKAITFDELKYGKGIHGTLYTGIIFFSESGKPEIIEDIAEANKIAAAVCYGKIRGKYSINTKLLYDIEEITEALKTGQTMTFYIGK